MTTHPHGNPGAISANPDTLRAVAAQLASAAQDLEALAPQFKEIEAEARKEASQHTTDGAASPVFSPLLTSLVAVGRKVFTGLSQLQQNVAGDAAELKKLADNLEGTDKGHAAQIAGTVV